MVIEIDRHRPGGAGIDEGHIMKIAIFDTNAGLLQWIGQAESHDAAIRQCDKDTGGLPESAYPEQIDTAGDSLRIMDVTEEQAAALEAWSGGGSLASHYPKNLPAGVVYTSCEVIDALRG